MKNTLLKNSRHWVDANLYTRTVNTLLIFALVFAMRWAVNDIVEFQYPVQLFLLSALLVTMLYGYVPALCVLMAGWFLGLFFFVPPFGEFSSVTKSDVIRTINYFVTGLSGIAVIEYLQRTRYSMRLMLAVSESRYRSLLRLDNHRLFQQRQSTRALRQVGDIFTRLEQVLLLISQSKKAFLFPLFRDITGRPRHQGESDWLGMLHAEDRPRVEKELSQVIDGFREHRDLQFRISTIDKGFVDVECEFRSLTMSAQKQVFALLLKSPRTA